MTSKSKIKDKCKEISKLIKGIENIELDEALKIDKSRMRVKERNLVREMKRSGLTIREICFELNISVGKVSNYLYRDGKVAR